MSLERHPPLPAKALLALLAFGLQACAQPKAELTPVEPMAAAEDTAPAPAPVVIEAEPSQTPTPEPEPSSRDVPTAELPPPTAEELAAWDRKDPDADKRVYEWLIIENKVLDHSAKIGEPLNLPSPANASGPECRAVLNP